MSDSSIAIAESIDAERHRAAAPVRAVARHGVAGRIWRCAVWLNVAALIAFGVMLRCRDLGNIPGINGDEAWYGVQAELLLHGESPAWRTPSGNLLNPLFFIPQVALNAIFGPAFVVLRATAVGGGLLALAVNFWLCRRVFGRRIAIISTTLLAVLPIDIVYSRLAWDASQSLLVTLPCVYLPLWASIDERRKRRYGIASIAAMLLAVVVHPTNLFVAPIVVVCLAYAWRGELRRIAAKMVAAKTGAWQPDRRRVFRVVGLVATIGTIALLIGEQFDWPMARLGPVARRAVNPQQYAEFLGNFGRLFSGATVYEYLSGAIAPAGLAPAPGAGFNSERAAYDLAAWLIGAIVVWLFIAISRRSSAGLSALGIGFAASLFAFFLVAGPGALAPNFERYALWTVAPMAILASVAIGSWTLPNGREHPGTARFLSTAVALSVGWAMLCGAEANLFDFIQQTGGRSHRTFRTGPVEPKQAALEWILSRQEPSRAVRIETSEWWIYWPIRYLSLDERLLRGGAPIDVELLGNAKCASSHSSLRAAVDQTGLEESWRVEFSDSAASDTVRREASADGVPLRETKIDDFAERPVLSIFAISAPPENPARRKGIRISEKN